MKIDRKFIAQELATLESLRDKADAQAGIWKRNYERYIGAIEALQRLGALIEVEEAKAEKSAPPKQPPPK